MSSQKPIVAFVLGGLDDFLTKLKFRQMSLVIIASTTVIESLYSNIVFMDQSLVRI